MQEPGLDDRHRDKNGEISRKHGNTMIATLRKIYGSAFAAGVPDTETLSNALESLDEISLSQLLKHHKEGTLGDHIEQAGN